MPGTTPSRPQAPGVEPLPRSGPDRGRQRLFSLQEELFLQAMAEVRRRCPGLEVGAGLNGVRLLDWSGSTLHLEVAHAFSCGLFERGVRPHLEAALQSITGTVIRLRLHVARPQPARLRGRVRAGRSAQSDLSDFVRDENNWTAFQLLMQVGDGRTLFDPLLIHGPPRCGKTHLIRGFLERVKRRSGGRDDAVRYMTAPVFGRAFRAAGHRRRLDRFRREVDGPGIFILDDVHRLGTMPGTQREVARLLERRRDRGLKTVCAARPHPDHAGDLVPALRTRLLGGLVVGMKPPRPESLVRHLKKRLLKRGVRLERSVLERAIELGDGHPLSAETLILDAVRAAHLERRPLTADALAPVEPRASGPGPDGDGIRRLAERIAGFFGVSAAELRSPRKVRRALKPRRLLALALRRGFGLPSAEIGRFLGGRSVSTVTVLLRQGKALLEEDPGVAEMVEQALADLEAGG